MNNPSFTPFEFRNGELFDYSANAFPTCLYSWTQQGMAFWSPTSTYYGYVYDGLARMTCDAGTFVLSRGMYFAVPTTEHNGSAFAIEGGMGIVVERIGFPGVFQIGGPIERVGRLRYIDGCTDSLLIPPVKLGDPCLNALYFPPGTDQTQHTHPSMRVGIVVDGQGECVTPDDGIPLFPGQIFIIHEEGLLEQVAREVDAELSDPIEIEVDTNGAQSKLQGLFGLARFNQLGQAVASVSEAFREVIDVGVEYEASLAAVGAITGQSGDALNELGEKARALALQFGGSATSQLASFQGILRFEARSPGSGQLRCPGEACNERERPVGRLR